MRNICGIFMKISSLQNRVSKLMPKRFYEIAPGVDLTKKFDTIFTYSFLQDGPFNGIYKNVYNDEMV
jgi:hypothetical protein